MFEANTQLIVTFWKVMVGNKYKLFKGDTRAKCNACIVVVGVGEKFLLVITNQATKPLVADLWRVYIETSKESCERVLFIKEKRIFRSKASFG